MRPRVVSTGSHIPRQISVRVSDAGSRMAVETHTAERTTAVPTRAQGCAAPRPQAFTLGYRPELDGVRGVAILLVFTYHLFARQLPGAFLGVDIFFVLSGFLITCLLVEEWRGAGRIGLKNFYARRALRLLPALLLWVSFFAACAPFLDSGTAHGIYYGIAGSLSYVLNWLMAFKFPPDSPLAISWSLAIEEQFYLIFPPALGLALRRGLKTRTIVAALALVVVTVEVHRALLWRAGAEVRRVYYATDARADALMVGCMLGVLVACDLLPRAAWLRRLARASAVAAVLSLAYLVQRVSWRSPHLYEGGLTVISVGIASALGALLLYPSPLALGVLRFPPLVWFGRISYGLYLWHYPVISILGAGYGSRSRAAKLLAAALSILAAALSYHLVERRFLHLKKQFGRPRI